MVGISENQRFMERLEDFARALSRLAEGLAMDSDSSIIVDGCIRRFEFTYELGWNASKAYLEYGGALNPRTPREIIRESYRVGLIEDGDAWLDMMVDRNLTSHTYD
ncbi:MAG: nucleotidyltransferase substrate binding protein [Firmicutes bacterium]|nr:nucleotidyltransferase substrate binding protein [Bacillota bacterium]